MTSRAEEGKREDGETGGRGRVEGGKSGGQRIGRGWISIARAVRVLDLSARLINAHPTKVLVDYVLRIIPFLYFRVH